MSEPNPVLVEAILEIINDFEYASIFYSTRDAGYSQRARKKYELATHIARFIEELNKDG